MCQNYIKYVISPIPYFDLEEKVFSAEADDAYETCTKRSEGRLKKYTSCTDSRAWHFDQDQRRRHLIDLMRKDAGRKCYSIPIELLYELLCRNSENRPENRPENRSENRESEDLNSVTERNALKSLRNIVRVVRLSGKKQPCEMEQIKSASYNIPLTSVQSSLNLVATRIRLMSDFVGCDGGQNCQLLKQLHELDDYVKCIQKSITHFGAEMTEHIRVLLPEVENLYAELKNKRLEPVKICSKSLSEKGSVCSVNFIESEVEPRNDINQVVSQEVYVNNDLLENYDGIEEEVRQLKELADSSQQLQFLLDESVKKCKFLSKESDVIRSERDFLRMVVENMKNQEEEYKASLCQVEAIVKMYDKVFSEKHKLLVEDCQELREKNIQLTKLIKSLNLNHDCQVSVTSLSKEVCSLWRLPAEKLSSAHSVDSLSSKNTIEKVLESTASRQVPNRRRKQFPSRLSQKPRKPDSRCPQTVCSTCVPHCSEGDIELFLSYETGDLYSQKNIRMG